MVYITLYLETLISKVRNCNFGGVIRVINNHDKFNNNQYKDWSLNWKQL